MRTGGRKKRKNSALRLRRKTNQTLSYKFILGTAAQAVIFVSDKRKDGNLGGIVEILKRLDEIFWGYRRGVFGNSRPHNFRYYSMLQ
jgi:hypothetical protein